MLFAVCLNWWYTTMLHAYSNLKLLQRLLVYSVGSCCCRPECVRCLCLQQLMHSSCCSQHVLVDNTHEIPLKAVPMVVRFLALGLFVCVRRLCC